MTSPGVTTDVSGHVKVKMFDFGLHDIGEQTFDNKLKQSQADRPVARPKSQRVISFAMKSTRQGTRDRKVSLKFSVLI